MKRLLKQSLFILYAGFLLLTVSCRDDSLREDLEIKESQEGKGDNDNNNNEYIRVVFDPETALATANCIMIKPGEVTSVPVAKAFAVWEQNQTLFGKKFFPNGDLGAVLIWALPNDLIDSEYLEITGYEDINKATINVKSKPGSIGNAVVALTVDGEVRWSWHLWVTDYDPDKDLQPNNLKTGPNMVDGGKVYFYKNNAGDNIFMDRNLGANSADKIKGKETHGMYYQWGKKDPLPGFAPPNYFPESHLDFPDEYRKNNLAYSIEHPDEYIDAAVAADWYTYYKYNYYDDKTYNHDLWGSVSKRKSIYDPCPEGWRVPSMGMECEYEKFSQWPEFSPWYIKESEGQFVDAVTGNMYDRESPVLGFYPAAGGIWGRGELSEKDKSISLWTVNHLISPYNPNKLLEESVIGYLNHEIPTNFVSRNKAYPVRCVRYFEEKNK